MANNTRLPANLNVNGIIYVAKSDHVCKKTKISCYSNCIWKNHPLDLIGKFLSTNHDEPAGQIFSIYQEAYRYSFCKS